MKKILSCVALVILVAVGCSDSEPSATNQERRVVERNEKQQLKGQPAPTGAWSQLRQNLIDIEAAQIGTTATTTFMFHMGNPNPVKECSSIGFPIPATYQLTNPEKLIDSPRYSEDHVVAQQETTGVYTGDTSGTYVICVDDSGNGRITYWEGPVETETGEATWNKTTHQIESTGKSTAEVNIKK